MLEIHDLDGQREMFISLADFFLSTTLAGIPHDKLDMPALLDACGVGRSAASGSSVRKDNDAWLLRSYAYQPKGRKGMATLLGTAAAPFLAPETLPASVDLVIEARLDIASIPTMMTEIARATGQEESATGFLKQELPSGGVLLDVLGQSKLHLIAGFDISSWEQPEGKKHLDFFIRINGGKMILQSLQPQITDALGEPEAVGTSRQWQIPLDGLGQESALLLADETGTITLVSTRKYLEAAQGSQGKLAADADFLAASDHFPKSGNLLVYASPQTPPFLATLIKQLAVPKMEKEVAPLLAKAADYLEPRPWSLCLALETDGTSILSELPFPFDTEIVNTLPLLSATSVLFIGAKAWKDGSDRATCVLNIGNVQKAARSYQNINELEIGDTIPWDKIFGPNGFLPQRPVCPSGGTYTFATVFPEISGITCQCSHADHKPTNHENW